MIFFFVIAQVKCFEVSCIMKDFNIMITTLRVLNQKGHPQRSGSYSPYIQVCALEYIYK